jgi:hypothetical protein
MRRNSNSMLTSERRAPVAAAPGEPRGLGEPPGCLGARYVRNCLELPPLPLRDVLVDLGCAGHPYGRDFTRIASAEASTRHLMANHAQNVWDQRVEAMADELAGNGGGEGDDGSGSGLTVEVPGADADSVDVVDALGRSRLMWAAMRGQYACAAGLLDMGASVTMADLDGWTALIWAAAYGQAELLQLLIDRGSQLDAKSEAGWAAFHYACFMGKAQSAAALIRAGYSTETKCKARAGANRWSTVRWTP